MANIVNLDGYQDSKYFARSWTILKQDPHWLRQLFLLWLAGLVPIVGPLGVLGYTVEQGRLVAWGSNTSPRQAGITVGACIKSGWRAFLVMLGWSALCGLIEGLIEAPLDPYSALYSIVSSIFTLLNVLLALFVAVASLRATIYQKIGAGYKASTIFQMISNDFVGLLRILFMVLVGALLSALVFTVVFALSLAPSADAITNGYYALYNSTSLGTAYNEEVFDYLVQMFTLMMPPMTAGFSIASFFTTAIGLLEYIALGLWIRQYNVPAWGGNDDPLPARVQASPYAQSTQYNAPGQVPYGYGYTDYGQQAPGSAGGQAGSQGQDQNSYQPPYQ